MVSGPAAGLVLDVQHPLSQIVAELAVVEEHHDENP